MNRIRFAAPDMTEHECKSVNRVIESGWLTNGPVVRDFEEMIAIKSGCKKAVAFDSCTGAMEMALRVLGIGDGDDVITTPYTYSATAEVIRNVGAKIVFVDLAEDSFEMDYDKLEEAINSHTKAVMPVDIGGKLCDYERIFKAIRSKQRIFNPSNTVQADIGRVAIVADAAHSFGADLLGYVSGQFADFTCFSFHVLKNLTTGGEGGAVVWRSFDDIGGDTTDEYIERQLRLYGDHGQTSRDKSKGWEYDIELFGYNSIMTNIDAAMGIAQLNRFDEIRNQRIEITKRYDRLFDDCNEARPLIQHFGDNYTSAMHLYPIELNTWYAPYFAALGGDKLEEWRTGIYKTLLDNGVPCNVHYKPLPMMTAYKKLGFRIEDYPNAHKRFATLLTIPYHTYLDMEQQEYIVKQIRKAVKPNVFR